MSAVKRITINISSNYLGTFVGIVVALILTPLLVRHLGCTGYGVWITLSTIILFIGYLDFGLEDALVKYVAEYKAASDDAALTNTITTSLSVYAAIGVLALALSMMLSLVVTSFFNIPEGYAEVARNGLVVFGVLLLIEFPSTALYSIIEGHQRYDILNVVAISSTILEAAATITLVLLDYGLLQLIQLSLAVTVLEFVAALLIIRRTFPHVPLKIAGIDAATFRKLRNFSFWAFMFDLMSDGWVHLQKFIIPILFYTALNTHYAIAIMLASIMVVAVDPMVNIIFPLVSELEAKNDDKSLHNVLLYGTKYAMAISLPLFVAVLTLGEPIVVLLFEKDYLPIVFNLIQIMLFSYLATVSILPAVSLLIGIGKLKRLFFFSLAECAVVALLIILTKDALGIYSIAFSFALANMVFALGFILPYSCCVINMPFAYFVKNSLFKPIIPLIPILPAAILLRQSITAESFLSLGAVTVAIVVVYAVTFYTLSLSRTERHVILASVKPHLFGFGKNVC